MLSDYNPVFLAFNHACLWFTIKVFVSHFLTKLYWYCQQRTVSNLFQLILALEQSFDSIELKFGAINEAFANLGLQYTIISADPNVTCLSPFASVSCIKFSFPKPVPLEFVIRFKVDSHQAPIKSFVFCYMSYTLLATDIFDILALYFQLSCMIVELCFRSHVQHNTGSISFYFKLLQVSALGTRQVFFSCMARRHMWILGFPVQMCRLLRYSHILI